MNYSSFAKGLAAGVAVGGAAVMFSRPMSDKQKHRLHRKTEYVFKNLSNIIDTALEMLK